MVTLRIVLERPPPGVDYALQEGRGNNYALAQKQRSTGRDLRFEAEVEAVGPRNAEPDFRGPHVQGAKGSRFLYLDIGTYAGQTDTEWARRLKVPLDGIAWKDLDASVLVARVPGTAKDGSPSCAAVWRKALDAWSWEPAKR